MVKENAPGPIREAATRSSWIVVGLAACVAWLLAPTSAAAQAKTKAEAPPTFTRDVAPILQQRCQSCHRRQRVGPFPLETYEQARKRADDIAAVASDRVMPPWKPAPGIGPTLKHDQSMSRREIAILEAWADAGAPEGDPKHMPPPMAHRPEGEWTLGPPDLVLEPAEDFSVPTSGPDVYRCFVIPTTLPKDVYISAIDFHPGNTRVVHHLSSFIDTTGSARVLDKADPAPGYVSFSGPGFEGFTELTFWTAGHRASFLPDGIGYRLPRQADLVLQIHYHPSGKPEVDRTKVGIYFARKPVKRAVHWNTAANMDFRLPAGESKIEVKGSWYVPVDVEALAVSPHMHSLGRQMHMTVTFPDGRTRDLIHIKDWDPAWQGCYFFQQPITLPRGSIVKVVAVFDNSAHARNPTHPPKLVTYGNAVDDEMCEGFIAVVKKGQDLTQPRAYDDLSEIFAMQRLRNQYKQITTRRAR